MHIVSLMSTGIVPVCVVTIVACGYTVAVRTSAQVHTTNYQILAPPGAVTGAISLTIQVLIFIPTILKYLTHLISCPDYRRIQTFLLSLPLLVSAQVSAARRHSQTTPSAPGHPLRHPRTGVGPTHLCLLAE